MKDEVMRESSGVLYFQKGKFVHKFNLKPVNQSCCSVNSDGCTMKNEPCGARFGTAVAAVSDLNLDGFNDVVIGAPFENDHRGAVYIYHGQKSNPYLNLVQVRITKAKCSSIFNNKKTTAACFCLLKLRETGKKLSLSKMS